MSGGTLTWTNRSPTHDHSHPTKSYQSTVDQARAFAAELGPDLALAFDKLSGKTAMVLRAYVADVFQEGHPYSKVKSIRDAMKQYFEDRFYCWGAYWQFLHDQDEEMFGEGEDDIDEERGEWIGNPVYATEFVSMMQELKDQSEKEEGTHQAKRRTTIGYEDMTQLILHLQKPETTEAEGLGRCLFFQALAATAFTLWLTFDEILKLKRGHIRFRRSDFDGSAWFSITVPFRTSSPMNPAQANVYEIYSQPEEPYACCVTYLLQWIQWVELKEGRRLQEDDPLFSNLIGNDQIQLDQHFSAVQMSTLLNKYARDAGVMDYRYNRLDTHCFRRGGAQHRLTHAQDPWPFKAIKWWGGWAEREPAEKIMEYLLDDYQYEASFGNIMSPRGSKSRGHIGMAGLPAEMMVTKECFKSTIRSMETRHATAMAIIEKELKELRQQNSHFRQENIEWRGAISLQLEKVVHMLPSQVPSDPHRHPSQQQVDQPQRPLQRPAEKIREQRPQHKSSPQSPPLPSQLGDSQNPVHTARSQRQLPPPGNSQDLHTQPSSSQHPKAKIPPINNWKEAIKQWYEGDPENGLNEPLSEWTPKMRYGQATFSNRKLIASEFELLGCSDTKMRQVYGSSLNGVGTLVTAIRKRHKKLRQEDEQDEEAEEAEEEEEEEEEEGEEEEQEEDEEEGSDNLTELPIPRVTHWKDVIRQWEEGDPDNGLSVPLRMWSLEMRRTHKVYPARKVIAKEFERCGKDEATMRQLYGASLDGLQSLIVAIRKLHKLQGINTKIAARSQTVNDSDTESEKEDEENGEEGGTAGPIPTVPRIRTWKQAVEQWEKGDPEHGLAPMRDWPEEWRKTSRTRMLCLARRRIAEEFEFCGRDEIRMRKLHGEAMDCNKDLLDSIRGRLGVSSQWKSKSTLKNTVGDEEEELEELEELEEEGEEEEEEALTKKRKLALVANSSASLRKKRP
ncbi:hypothetical protein BGZ81_002317 [Podila clonocystis]|nr:hypothetical protein BGZ81_002317 [Podila clonocystis]